MKLAVPADQVCAARLLQNVLVLLEGIRKEEGKGARYARSPLLLRRAAEPDSPWRGLAPAMDGDMHQPVGVQQHRRRGPADAGHGQGRHAARAERACLAEGASSRGLFPIDNPDSLTSTLKVPGDGQPDDSRSANTDSRVGAELAPLRSAYSFLPCTVSFPAVG